MDLRTVLFSSGKNGIGILMGIALHLEMAFAYTTILQ
jgi:hypothetical protein